MKDSVVDITASLKRQVSCVARSYLSSLTNYGAAGRKAHWILAAYEEEAENRIILLSSQVTKDNISRENNMNLEFPKAQIVQSFTWSL